MKENLPNIDGTSMMDKLKRDRLKELKDLQSIKESESKLEI